MDTSQIALMLLLGAYNLHVESELDEDLSNQDRIACSKKRNLEIDSPLPRTNLFPARKKRKLEIAAPLPGRPLPRTISFPRLPSIVITGKGGFPLYAFTNVDELRDVDPCPALNYGKEADFKNINSGLCKISTILDAEIRLDGVKIARLGDCNELDNQTVVGDTNASMFFEFHSASHRVAAWEGRTISVHIGFNPLPVRMRETICIEDLTDDEISQVRFESLEVTTLEDGQ